MKSRLKIADMLLGEQDFISGQELAGKLGISRTGVWKQVQELRHADFIIEARPRLGYRILSCPDKLLPVIVKKGLETSVIGRSIYYYQSLSSTNSVAKSLAHEGAAGGTLIITEEQVGGRGRCGRRWVSSKGDNILLSIILRPDILPHQVPRVAILGAVSVADSIRKVTGIKAELRWPNEILVNDKKVGGILTEFDAELDRVNFVILGIGINVNLDLSAFPDLEGDATSLTVETGARVSRLELLQVLLGQIESGLRLIEGDEFNLIKERWHALGWRLSEWVRIDTAAGKDNGILKGIDSNGSLVIDKEGGEIRIAMSGDVLLKIS